MNIDHTKDIDQLRQMAKALEFENKLLHKRIVELTSRLDKLEGKDADSLQQELALLKEQLDARNRALFGPSSEKRPTGHTEPVRDKRPQTGHGPREQPRLKQEVLLHELDEADKVCIHCGGALEEFPGQFDETEEITVVEREFRLVKHRCQKYICRCGCTVDTALGPEKLIPGGRYSVEFATTVAIDKYEDHLPLSRQVKRMAREGIDVTSSTLWDQFLALANHLQPSYEALLAYVVTVSVLGVDETRWPLLKTHKPMQYWAWAMRASDAIAYAILESRSAAAAGSLLSGFSGTLVVDGYKAYTALQKRLGPDEPRFELAFCWAHVRRKFVEAEPFAPKAAEVVELIRKLYEVERRADNVPEMRATWRRLTSGPVTDEILAWLQEHKTSVLPKSKLGKAIQYTIDHWVGLIRFVKDPALPLDNNDTERGIRALAVGRKNHFGSKSIEGTRVSALFYSLIESARLVGLDPTKYLIEAARRAIHDPGTVTLPQDLITESS